MNEELNKKSVSGAENEDARDISDASCMILDKRVNKSKLVTDFTRHLVPFTEKIQWHNFSRDGQTAKDVIDIKLVRHILCEARIYIISGIPYIYENGYYQADMDQTRLKAIIALHLESSVLNINTLNRIYNLFINTNSIQRRFKQVNNFDARIINFKNGLFDPVTWEMKEHTPDYFSINQIPWNFDPNAKPKGKVTKSFIDFTIPDPADREMFWQYAGYCLTPDTRFQKFLILRGQAGTGKSRLIHIIENMVGEDNLSNISLQQLNERFHPSMMLGKLLNSCADIPSKAMDTVDGVKKATGEDFLFAEKKGKDGFSFLSYAKLLFSANEMPINIDEKSEALYRRMLIIKVDRKPEKINEHLGEELDAEVEYSIMEACRALHKLYVDRKFTESKNSKDNVQEVYMEADTVTAFLIEKTKKVANGSIKAPDLYDAYKDYCESNDRKPSGRSGFHKAMKNKGYSKKRISTGEIYEELELDEGPDEFIKVPEGLQEQLPWEMK